MKDFDKAELQTLVFTSDVDIFKVIGLWRENDPPLQAVKVERFHAPGREGNEIPRCPRRGREKKI